MSSLVAISVILCGVPPNGSPLLACPLTGPRFLAGVPPNGSPPSQGGVVVDVRQDDQHPPYVAGSLLWTSRADEWLRSGSAVR